MCRVRKHFLTLLDFLGDFRSECVVRGWVGWDSHRYLTWDRGIHLQLLITIKLETVSCYSCCYNVLLLLQVDVHMLLHADVQWHTHSSHERHLLRNLAQSVIIRRCNYEEVEKAHHTTQKDTPGPYAFMGNSKMWNQFGEITRTHNLKSVFSPNWVIPLHPFGKTLFERKQLFWKFINFGMHSLPQTRGKYDKIRLG